MFFFKQMQMFCMPYLCCPCLAVLQDRRALLKNKEMLEIARKAIADSSFRMDAVTEEESENNDKESVAVKTDEDGEATTEKKEEKN